jgi:hypothetical protein
MQKMGIKINKFRKVQKVKSLSLKKSKNHLQIQNKKVVWKQNTDNDMLKIIENLVPTN